MRKGSRILYDGPSELDGVPIIAVATQQSGNTKTGAMLQTWILARDIDPISASRTGADASICGACVHRGTVDPDKPRGLAVGRSCYVNLGQAPLGVWRAAQRGSYGAPASLADIADIGAGQLVRLGSYGDPAAVPRPIWDALLAQAKGRTGYTHQLTDGANALRDITMTSADTADQARAAWARGERTFRVLSAGDAPIAGREITCPASAEAGHKTTCDRCRLCAGADVRAPSIVIEAHGSGAKHARARKIIPIRLERAA